METNKEKKSFSELLQASFKSNDTEEWLDVHFTRPIGLVFALLWNSMNIHPNVITILSIFLGIGSGYMFMFEDMMHNILGVVLLMFANFFDSTDGQMARLTGKKTLIGRMLDGFSGDVWFFCIYAAFAYRLMDDNIPFTNIEWDGGHGCWQLWLAFCSILLKVRLATIIVRFTSSSLKARMVASSTTMLRSVLSMRDWQRKMFLVAHSTSTMPTTARARRNAHLSSNA